MLKKYFSHSNLVIVLILVNLFYHFTVCVFNVTCSD